MKFLLLIFFLFIVTSCSISGGGKSVYWCGDHACVNKKERMAYFKKTMIVEKKFINKKNKLSKSEIKNIKEKINKEEQGIYLSEKNKKKIAKLKEKELIKEEKKRLKQNMLDEKIRLKEEKKRLKKALKDEKKKIKMEKKKLKKSKKNLKVKNQNLTSNNKFDQLKKRIIKVNFSKDFPDINNVPN